MTFWLIAKREYLEQIRGKAFKVTTILIPVVFAAIFGVIAMAGKNSGVGKHIVVAASRSVAGSAGARSPDCG